MPISECERRNADHENDGKNQEGQDKIEQGTGKRQWPLFPYGLFGEKNASPPPVKAFPFHLGLSSILTSRQGESWKWTYSVSPHLFAEQCPSKSQGELENPYVEKLGRQENGPSRGQRSARPKERLPRRRSIENPKPLSVPILYKFPLKISWCCPLPGGPLQNGLCGQTVRRGWHVSHNLFDDIGNIRKPEPAIDKCRHGYFVRPIHHGWGQPAPMAGRLAKRRQGKRSSSGIMKLHAPTAVRSKGGPASAIRSG
jgi:hypothetical protein